MRIALHPFRWLLWFALATCATYALLTGGEAHAQAETGMWVCSVYNPSTGQCTAYAPIAEGVMSGETIGFTPEVVNYSVGYGLGIIILFFIVGVCVGVVFRLITSALNPGPL